MPQPPISEWDAETFSYSIRNGAIRMKGARSHSLSTGLCDGGQPFAAWSRHIRVKRAGWDERGLNYLEV